MISKSVRCSILLLFLPCLIFAGIVNDGEKVQKKINREFNIQSNGRVEILNKYGNIDIAVGESNRVKFEIVISATAATMNKAREALDKIDVSFQEGSNRVNAETRIESSGSNWLTWFNKGNVDIDIHYTVLVPSDIFLQLSNKYGNIYVETANRDTEITLGYGDLKLGDINGRLHLDMSYSDGSISQINDGALVLRYSDLAMEDGNDVSLDMKYSEVKAGSLQKLKLVSAYSDFQSISIRQMDYEGKYDDVSLDHVNTIRAQTGYTDIRIDGLTGEGNFDMRYGDLKLRNIQRGFSKLDINTSYTGVDLGFKADASFTVDAVTNYCDVHHNALKISENHEKGANHILKASRGSGSGLVYVRMNYGELKIF